MIEPDLKKADLLALPVRAWQAESTYDWLYLVPTGKKHSSSWAEIAIVGARDNKPVEIAAFCDDIGWSFPARHPYDGIHPHEHWMVMRTDCLWPSRIIRCWASGEHYFVGRFKVGTALSSTEVALIVEPRGDPTKLADRLAKPAYPIPEPHRP